jgi:hypothetical protein
MSKLFFDSGRGRNKFTKCCVLDAFAKLRKASISFIMSVLSVSLCPSAWNNLDCNWTDFHEVWVWGIFKKIFRENSIFIKNMTRITGTLHEDLRTFTISRRIILRIYKISKENQNTHFYDQQNFCRKSCRPWDSVERYGTARQAKDYNIIWRTHISCWINKASNTDS